MPPARPTSAAAAGPRRSSPQPRGQTRRRRGGDQAPEHEQGGARQHDPQVAAQVAVLDARGRPQRGGLDSSQQCLVPVLRLVPIQGGPGAQALVDGDPEGEEQRADAHHDGAEHQHRRHPVPDPDPHLHRLAIDGCDRRPKHRPADPVRLETDDETEQREHHRSDDQPGHLPVPDFQHSPVPHEERTEGDHAGDADDHGIDEHCHRHRDRVPGAADLRLEQELLGNEAEKRGQPRHGQAGECGGHGRNRQKSSEAPHQAQLAQTGCVQDGPRAEEQRRLVERVGQDVSDRRDARHRPVETDEHHQDPERRHRGVGQHGLEVLGAQRLESADQHRGEGETDQRIAPAGYGPDHRLEACQQVDAELHHRGRVQVGRDGRGRLHGVRQPEMERELSRLGEGTGEETDHDRHDPRATRQLGRARDRPGHRVAAERRADENDRSEQREPAARGHAQRHQRRPPS